MGAGGGIYLCENKSTPFLVSQCGILSYSHLSHCRSRKGDREWSLEALMAKAGSDQIHFLQHFVVVVCLVFFACFTCGPIYWTGTLSSGSALYCSRSSSIPPSMIFFQSCKDIMNSTLSTDNDDDGDDKSSQNMDMLMFLSDPGVPGVRSMGPVLSHWLSLRPLCRLNWCDSGRWRYQLNTNW